VNYYKRHLGDIAKSLSNLSQGRMGAYDLLLDWLYANEKPLPLHKDELYLIGRCSCKAERDNVDRVLEYFDKTDSGYTQKRAMEEIDAYNRRCEVNREQGKRGGRPKVETQTLTDSVTDSDSQKNPSQNPESIKELEPANAGLSPASPEDETDASGEQPEKGRPPCPQERIVTLYHEVLPELRQVREWNETRRRLLARRWAEQRERQTLDWWREYFGYVRKSRFLMGQTTGRDGRAFDCDLEWLVRPTNFAKVVEGKYEDAQ